MQLLKPNKTEVISVFVNSLKLSLRQLIKGFS